MQIKDFLEQYNIDSKKALEAISIKSHISFKLKYSLLEQIKDTAIDYNEGVAYYDSLTGDFLFNIAIIKFYTDLEFSDDSMDELDELKRIGAFDEITDKFFYDHFMLEKHYGEKVQTILNMENSTQNLINREVIKVSNKAIETLDNIASNLDKKTLAKIMSEIKNGVGKFSTASV